MDEVEGPGIVPFGTTVVCVRRDPTGTAGLFAVFRRDDFRLLISCCRRLIRVPINVSLAEGAGGGGGGGVTGAGGGGAGARVNVPPLLPVMVFPFASTLNIIFRGPLGVVYTRFPPVSDVNVPVTKDHPEAVDEGVSVQEFPV